MAKRDDIHKVLIIGSGPIVIGQACEFDYSGTQACKALRACGYKIVLVNSNPATIMTDPVMADATYIEPLNVERLEQIIAKERPDALLPNLGGQTGLNLSIALAKAGILAKYNVEVIGVNLNAIERGEDREIFKETMRSLGIGLPDSRIIHTVGQAEQAAAELNYPVVIRPAYTMGGAGGGLVYNIDELRATVARGLDLSLTRQCLIEQSILGWEELEVEVVRDASGKMVVVCFIENVDAVGVHTGDSFCTAPMLTIPVDVQQECQRIAFKVVESIGVIGGTNVQLARDSKTGRIVIIEINPRTSRSSALASKATGFPIALVSAQLASGINLADLPYWRDGTLDKYTPSGDYVVVKFARWAFEKFKGSQDKLGTQMKAVGEVMSIGKTYKEAFQKAIRALENGRPGLGHAKNFNTLAKDELLSLLRTASSERHYIMYEALRKGATVAEVTAITYVKEWFVQQMLELVQLEEKIAAYKVEANPRAACPTQTPQTPATALQSPEFDALLRQAKLDGFSDKYLAKILHVPEKQIRDRRTALGIVETWDAIPVSGVENACYYYSTYQTAAAGVAQTAKSADATPSRPIQNPDPRDAKAAPKVMILGGGPNRIGQGIEFDYCCCHAAMSLRDAGYETIMVNCNPETVSTDYDTSDKLYFEPLTVEDVLQIHAKEKPMGVVVQFGGQTPLNIARELADNGVRILGTSIDSIDDAEDRDLFRHKMERLGIPMPESGMASTFDEAKTVADKIGYPIMIRPSFILGGRGMEVIYDEDMLREYVAKAIDVSPERPLLLDRFLQSALECEADALADGKDVFIPAVMEHIELAGVHSGDSACVIPPVSLSPAHLETINTYTRKIAQELKVVGLMNMQYAIENDKVYVLEANPRASRTVPLVSKVCNVQMARIATQLMLGASIPSMNLTSQTIPHYGVKEAVLPFDKFPEVDPILGPEMRSTGEVLGMSANFGLAFCKAQEAALSPLPLSGTVLMSVWERTPQVLEIARTLTASGFKLRATTGTRAFLAENGIHADLAIKIGEGRPDIPDDIKNGLVQFIINSPISKRASQKDDSYIRKAAIKHRVPYMTTLAAASAAAKGIAVKIKNPTRPIYSLQEYHANIK